MLLAIDSSTAQLGLALYNGVQVAGEWNWISKARHTVELATALRDLLSGCGITMNDIRAVGVAIGPGSFTSLRVGLSFAKGLVLARAIPIIGVPTLDVVASSVPITDKALAAVLQAGRGRLALVWYQAVDNHWQAQGPATVTTAEDLERKIRKPVIVCGELTAEERRCLARRYKNISIASPAQCVRRAGLLAEIAWKRWEDGKVDAAGSLAPIYLHVAGGLPG
jgi:tRNA threonylcarbamoyladenosine biosynthesis protein TsaB